jgi:hypothetical protein
MAEVMNKKRQVTMKKMDIFNLFELDTEKLQNDKAVNPHCLFLIIATVASHIILM